MEDYSGYRDFKPMHVLQFLSINFNNLTQSVLCSVKYQQRVLCMEMQLWKNANMSTFAPLFKDKSAFAVWWELNTESFLQELWHVNHCWWRHLFLWQFWAGSIVVYLFFRIKNTCHLKLWTLLLHVIVRCRCQMVKVIYFVKSLYRKCSIHAFSFSLLFNDNTSKHRQSVLILCIKFFFCH